MFQDLEYLRLNQIVKPFGILPIGRSTWWEGVAAGKFPPPVRSSLLGKRITLWRKKDIIQLLTKIDSTRGE